MATCLGEFGMTYEQYCNMTWAEFQIRLFSFKRVQVQEWEKVNFLSNTMIKVAPYMNSTEKNKMIKSNYKFLFGESKESKSKTELQKRVILKAQQEYKNKLKNG